LRKITSIFLKKLPDYAHKGILRIFLRNGARSGKRRKFGKNGQRPAPGALCRKNAATVIMNGRYYVPVAAVS
jgi:hypothetical protein